MRFTAIVMASLAAMSAATAQADVIASDSFEEYSLQQIAGQGLSGGGWENGWKGEQQGAFVIDVSANPLSAAGVSGGNQAMSLPNRVWSAAGRSLSTPLDTDAGYYISYLIRITTGNFQTWLWNGAGNSDHYFFGLENHIDGDVSSSRPRSQGGGELGSSGDYLLVARIKGSGVTVWLNPINESDPWAIHTTDTAWPDLTTIYFRNNKDDDDTVIDRLVIGETFADVVPEPASLSLLAAGAVALLARRRR